MKSNVIGGGGGRLEDSKAAKPEYEEYTLGLALFDLVPVLIFLMTGLMIHTMYDSRMLLAGVICTACGGLSKVIWKLLIVVKKRNYAIYTFMFHVLVPAGFALMMLSVIISAIKQAATGAGPGSSILAALLRAITMRPAMWCFIGGLAGLCLMGYLGARAGENARVNWIEEIVNTLAQGAILAGVIFVYLGTFYAAADAAVESLGSTDQVKVSLMTPDNAAMTEYAAGDYDPEEERARAGDVIFFDGPSREAALVFYPGARVEAEAYAPLMKSISMQGIDCCLCRMPANIALLDKDLAEDVREAENYDKWYIGGHSLGGAAAAMLLADNETASDWDGLILLAAYPTDKMSVPVLSIYGSEDGVLNRAKYDRAGSEGFWPDDFTEAVIEGGNHAQFGNYGAQKGDGSPAISEDRQQEQAVKALKDFIDSH